MALGAGAVLSALLAAFLSLSSVLSFLQLLSLSDFLLGLSVVVLSYVALSFEGLRTQAALQTELLSDIRSALKDQAEHVGATAWSTGKLSELQAFANTKLTYIEARIDASQATIRDSLRHVEQKLLEFDSSIGLDSVLQKWISTERDQWLQRPFLTTEPANSQLSLVLTVLAQLFA